MPGRWVNMVRTVDSNPTPTQMPDPTIAIAAGVTVIFLPMLLIGSVIAHRYHCKRSLQQQIAHLERSWRLKLSQDTHENQY